MLITNENLRQQIAVTDWRELNVGDTIQFDYRVDEYQEEPRTTVILRIDIDDDTQPIQCDRMGWPKLDDMSNIYKLIGR